MSQGVSSETGVGSAPPGTVDEVTRQLLAWLNAAAPELRYLETLPEPGDTPFVQVSLLRIRPGSAPSNRLAPLELQLDYLCTGSDASAPAVQRAFGEIAFAALASGAYSVSAAESGGLGLLLTARLIRSRMAVRGPRVRSRVRADLRPLASFSGLLLGPGDVALPGAAVRTAGRGSGAATHTGPDGRFTLAADVGPGEEVVLAVAFNGRQLSARGVAGATETAFLVRMEE